MQLRLNKGRSKRTKKGLKIKDYELGAFVSPRRLPNDSFLKICEGDMLKIGAVPSVGSQFHEVSAHST